MSTFKIPPVYAEALLRILDASTVIDGLKPGFVLQRFNWFFEGGTFGVRSEPLPAGTVTEEATSGTALPHGWTKDIAAKMAADGTDSLPLELGDIIRTRQGRRRTGRNEATSWAAIFAHCVEDDRRVSSGMEAVYVVCDKLMTACHYRTSLVGSRTKFRQVSAAATEIAVGASVGAELSLTHMHKNAQVSYNMMESYRIPEYNAVESRCKEILMTMATVRSDSNMDDLAEEVEYANDIEDEVDDFDFPEFMANDRTIGSVRVKVFPRAVVFRESRVSYLLSMSDWRKVVIMITGVRNYLCGCCSDAASGSVAKVAAASRTVSAVYMNLRDAVRLGASLPCGQHLDMAKAYKSMLAVVKAGTAGDRASVHRSELLKDMKATATYHSHANVLDLALSRISSLNPKGALAAAKIFRLLPPPDVWMARALHKRWEKASIVRTLPEPVIAEYKEALREVILTALVHDKSAKMELADPRRPPVWWPAYMARDLDAVPKSELAKHVKWRGRVKVVKRSRYDASTWKDSALGLDTFDLAMSDNPQKDLRNMLTRLLFDESCPMPEDVHQAVEEISAVMLKPESHKERIAYMNNLRSRMKQSCTEATVGSVMRHHPSFAPVRTGVQRDAAFEALSSPPPSVLDVPMASAYVGDYWVTLYYSFDITGWSENMTVSIQEATHAVWDEFTGGTEFSATTANHKGARVYMNNGGVKAWYTNGGANFEGYNGKEMTSMHVAIMTLAVKELRRRIPDVPHSMLRIMLQAYIDDGIARMTLPSTMCDRVFAAWEEVVIETWAKFGFEVEPKKSFPSYHYFEFLGEEFMAGRQLSSGSKAAMRITAEPFEAWETLPERIAKISAACRGACSAGMDPIGAIIMQGLFSAQEIATWVPVSDPAAAAMWALLPRGEGGLGMPGLIAQSENAVGAALEEGMATVHAWAASGTNPAVKEAYLKICRTPYVARTAAEVFSSPLGGKVGGGVLTMSHIARVTKRGLERFAAEGRLASTATVLIGLAHEGTENAYADAVLSMSPGEVVQEAVLKDSGESSLDDVAKAFLSRFEKEGTFLRVSSRRALRAVGERARAEAEESYLSHWSRVSGVRMDMRSFRGMNRYTRLM